MSVTRSLPILVSLAVAAGLWVWGANLMPVQQGSYGTLVCGGDIPDREIRERLEAQGFTGIISESGQWVLIDSFGSVELVPLDEYAARVLPFDPRNDGYAQKLQSLFVRDEQRFFYIPLNFPAALKPVGIDHRLAAALGDIPFSFHAASGLPKGWFLALFCLAALSFFFIHPLRMTLRPHAACLLPLLPALAPFALGGAAGFALASLLAGCAALLAGPYLQWRITQPRRRETLPALCRALPPMFVVFYGVIAFFSGLPLVFILPASLFFCVMLAFRLQDAYRAAASDDAGLWGLLSKRQDTDHRRFSPVPIFSRRYFTFAFSWAMLPFALVALALAGAGFAASPAGPAVSPVLPPADTVTEADYYRHYRFQSTFSLRSLNAPELDMSIYELAPDGLLNETKRLTNEGQGLSNETGDPDYGDFSPHGFIPPFPLGDVVRYLSAAGHGGGGGGGVHTLLAALLPLLFVFPILFRGGWLINQTYWGTLLKRLA